MENISFNYILTLILLFPTVSNSKIIDRRKTLFGIEYTFQDQEMINEPGRGTHETPYKRAMLEKLVPAYAAELGVGASEISVKKGRLHETLSRTFMLKPGYFIDAEDGRHVVNIEPVTLEVNTPPKKFSQIKEAAAPIFAAAEKVGLVPYVQPAGERSGMGHIHIGGRTFEESPFYLHPNLLRNLMVYTHKHPSLLFGFAEAFDIGAGSNIATHHQRYVQDNFRKAVAVFDKASRAHGDSEQQWGGVFRYLEALEGASFGNTFFRHSTWINLQHIRKIKQAEWDVEGKFTVEMRWFRPPKTHGHAAANVELLLDLMEYLARPGYLEPFETISDDQYDAFQTASMIEADWQIVREEIGHKKRLSDQMVKELVDAIRVDGVEALPGMEIFRSYSTQGDKGKYFEFRLDANVFKKPPRMRIYESETYYSAPRFYNKKVTIGAKQYWVGSFSFYRPGDTPESLASMVEFLPDESSCKSAIAN